jgi:UDP-glucose 4-epimerase
MSSVLITGGAGFVGSHVADAFLADGWKVTVLDDFSSGRHENVPLQAQLVEESVCSPAAARVVADGGFDVLVHCAAQMDVRRSVADPLHDATTNILGTVNLAEAVRSASPRTRIVFTSTGGALYGGGIRPPNIETHPKVSESPYSASKLAAENYLAYYGRVHGLETVSLRFGNVYGPRQDPHGEAGVIAIFCGRILEGRPLTVFGDGEQTRDYIYVSDIVRAVQLAATRDIPPAGALDARAFNIGTGKGIPVNTLAALLGQVAGRSATVEHAAPRAGEVRDSWLDAAKAERELGWTPIVALPEGLALTLAWFAQRASGGSADAA